ncbi:MAG: lamin tail domain-containing protein [Bryobacteraceae bacterium]
MKRACILALVVMSAALASAQAQVVISQIYGGGGNIGATLRNDFIELFNSGSTTVDLSGWTVQYASSTGTSWQTTPLSGSLLPGQYYLVQESAGTGGTQNLPTPDATGTMAMSATAAKVALISSVAALNGACPTGSSAVDFVGFGATNCSLGSPAPTLTNTTANLRGSAGCTNSGENSADFVAGPPNPRNTASPTHLCTGGAEITLTPAALASGTANVPYSVTFAAAGGRSPYLYSVTAGSLPTGFVLSPDGMLSGRAATAGTAEFSVTATDALGETGTAAYTLRIDATPTCNPTATIAQVQGPGDVSPLNGTTVTIQGIVTGTDGSGFFVQMATGDGKAATSDGIYVYTSASRLPASAKPGNNVCVTGPVNEYTPSTVPGAATDTEINSPSTVVLIATGNALPPPIVLTHIDPQGAFDQLERYEGMRVQIDSVTVVAPTLGSVDETNATSTSSGFFFGVLPGTDRPFREPGVQVPDKLPSGSACCITRWDSNPEVIGVDGGQLATKLEVATGATVTRLVGPLEFENSVYSVVLDPTSGAAATGGMTAAAVPVSDSAQLTISAFNLEHFYAPGPADPGTTHATPTAAAFANRLNKASLAIRNLLHVPDILAVEELQNLATIQALAAKINSDEVNAGQPNPNYRAFLSLGNDISGINSGFLVKTPKVSVNSVVQYGKDTTYGTPARSNAILNDRPPLVLTATALRDGSDTPLPVIVTVNHLRSLLSLDDPGSGPTVRAKREAQAEYLANLIQGFQTANPSANIVSIGDYNAYQFSDGYVDTIGVIKGNPALQDQVVVAGPRLVSPILTDLIDTDLIRPSQRYSYTFSGNAQAIDHIIVNSNMLSRATSLSYARVDADFPDSLRNDPTRPERVSDHDPAEASFALPLVVSSKVTVQNLGFVYNDSTHRYSGNVVLTNTSNVTIPGPIYMGVTNLPTAVVLVNKSGTQKGISFITAANSELVPGQSVTVDVEFTNPLKVPLNFTSVIYAGSL